MSVRKSDSYIVLARKWRPQKFCDLVGQEHVVSVLENSIKTNKVAHSYLFTGTRGVGKTTAARIFSRVLNCLEPRNGEACGQCGLCQDVLLGSCLDVIEIDGASNRGIDDIRDLREQVSYIATKGKYKIYIIDEVHMLTKEAFNALLKTLEEPPSHVIFIFATTEIRKVPQTILSRVQRFDFKPIIQEKITDRLAYIMEQENLKTEIEALQLVAQKADGSMRDALSYLDQVVALGDETLTVKTVQQILGIPSQKLYQNLFHEIAEGKVSECLTLLTECFSLGVEPKELLNGLGWFLRNLLFAKQEGMPKEVLKVSLEQLEVLKELGKSMSDTDLLRYSKGVSDILQELKSGLNPNLILEMGFVKLCHLQHIGDLRTILQSVKPQDSLKKESLLSSEIQNEKQEREEKPSSNHSELDYLKNKFQSNQTE